MKMYKHHITPKCMLKGYPNEFIDHHLNLVFLSIQHHISVHKWLFMLTGDVGCEKSWVSMSTGKFVNNGHSEIAREKMSESHKGKILSEEHKNNIRKNSAKFWEGKKFSEDHCKNIGLSKKGILYSKEVRDKVSKNSARYWKGKTRDKQTREKISISKKEYYKHNTHPQAKEWYIHGKLFRSANEAGVYFGVHRKTISKWCNNIPLCYSISTKEQL